MLEVAGWTSEPVRPPAPEEIVTPCTSATTTQVYDPRGAQVTYSPPLAPSQSPAIGSIASRTEFDLAGHALRQIKDWMAGQPTASNVNVTTSVAYDGFGRPTDKTDPQGVVTHADYDALDRPIAVTLDPTGLNLRTSYAYSLAGDLWCAQSPTVAD